MTTAEKAEMEALEKRVAELENRTNTMVTNLTNIINDMDAKLEKVANPMIYNYIDDNMPSWARDAVRAAINKGAIIGEGDGLGLTYSDLRAIVREYRMGMYD